MISSGVKCDAFDVNDQANNATIANDIMHIDRETRKTVVSCDRSRRCELKGVVSKSSALEDDPKRGVRSVGSGALRLPLSTRPDSSSLLIVGVGMVNTFGGPDDVFDLNPVAKYDYQIQVGFLSSSPMARLAAETMAFNAAELICVTVASAPAVHKQCKAVQGSSDSQLSRSLRDRMPAVPLARQSPYSVGFLLPTTQF
jgi:hypothetical protein